MTSKDAYIAVKRMMELMKETDPNKEAELILIYENYPQMFEEELENMVRNSGNAERESSMPKAHGVKHDEELAEFVDNLKGSGLWTKASPEDLRLLAEENNAKERSKDRDLNT